ncbi:MAG: helix-turn-helix transcriptional regulator [Lachnospiraceae bacterium]|jgi:transcriptional regulator with XRE-family HTH domain|nr:helix-turn-helix transcriptional regulator [Lachnospiraceae bacterium]
MENKFGEFVKAKRLEREISLRKLAEELEIVPAYMSDIEKGRRYPPDKEKIYKIAEVLHLDKEETDTLFDLAAYSRANGVSPDLSDYVMGVDNLRTALRKARDIKAGEEDWQRIIDMLESGNGNGGNE